MSDNLKEKEKIRRKAYYEENKEKINMQKRERRRKNHEEELRKQREYNEKNRERVNELARNQYWKNPVENRKRALNYVNENREEINERNREKYAENPEKYITKTKEYYENNKEKVDQKAKERYWENPHVFRKRSKKYREENKEEIIAKDRIYKQENKEMLRRKQYEKYWIETKYKGQKKQEILFDNLLSILKDSCIKCGIRDRDVLTIDHIKNNGNQEREIFGKGRSRLLTNLEKLGWPEDYIRENYQILCYNHNCAKESRDYFDKPEENLDRYQKRSIRIWKEAFNFFGPCKRCGEIGLKFLCVDHISGDARKDRKTGIRQSGIKLIDTFRKNNWPESLKKEYRFLCWNCNMKVYLEKLRAEEGIKYYFHCLFK